MDTGSGLAAVIFDFDGLILETEMPQYRAWRDAFARFGVSMPIDLWVRCLGRGTGAVDFVAHLAAATHLPVDREHVTRAARKQAGAEILAAEVMPGVWEYLDDAEQNGMRIGLASGSTRDWVGGHLDRLGLARRFETIVTHEDTDRHKPDPDPFLECARRLAVAPGRCLVLEDSPNGVLAAKAAGMTVIAVPTEMTAPLDLSAADLKIDSLASTSLAEAVARLVGG